ncbi:Hsp20/alpha crystallin family protein [Actinomycetospora sp. DW7H6]|uniref:Hsp20/alpha crystallin family protein n=2 Tax=Actinomycetospora lemnae TaxID=3019891 RepID=A0ABT5SZ12_9PSEU|nr:Hsp20/alpha crystallin family protein [Actinomycetospora sp. DW7H6]MDD7968100.1 Hsp20/alpha crystallin family protein [Actinomycetospora sp. DW7H6]
MALMRFDPFREFDRLAEQALATGARAARGMPMEALRRGDEFLVFLDLPGVRREDVDISVERNVVSIAANRVPQRAEGDEVIVDERPYGVFARHLFLGENLDPSGLSAEVDTGVLTLRIPVNPATKPRKIPVASTVEGSTGQDGLPEGSQQSEGSRQSEESAVGAGSR